VSNSIQTAGANRQRLSGDVEGGVARLPSRPCQLSPASAGHFFVASSAAGRPVAAEREATGSLFDSGELVASLLAGGQA
jgi:hypothetical protein